MRVCAAPAGLSCYPVNDDDPARRRALRALAPDAASFAFRLAVSYARGFALAEIDAFTLDAPGERLRALDLGPDEFPHLVELAPYLRRFDGDAAFAFGIEAILAGLGQHVTAP